MLIELKTDEFKYEHIGQLNTYVSWYKKHAMTRGDNSPVGILLCTRKNHAKVEYALAGMDNKLFVKKYQLELPKKEEIQKFIEAQSHSCLNKLLSIGEKSILRYQTCHTRESGYPENILAEIPAYAGMTQD